MNHKHIWVAERIFLFTSCAALLAWSPANSIPKLSQSDYTKISHHVWNNECDGKVRDLTSWNEGEDFASLGIGHFIWYPSDKKGPFEESFPKLITFLKENGADVPDWLIPTPLCPWKSRAEFMKDFECARMANLRKFLEHTVPLQGHFLAQRLQNALPKMLEAAPTSEQNRIEENFNGLASTPAGMFALIDYVNFKGEGTLESERYAGKGWGLLQVLEGMQGHGVEAFSQSAKRVIERRVENSPPERNEKRWLAGWRNRIAAYPSFK